MEHVCTPETCPDGANYFVGCTDAGKHWYMAGPYATHAEALAAVNEARRIASEHNPWSDFYAWGTCRSERTEPGSITKAGLLP